jgi:hypothetical protein
VLVKALAFATGSDGRAGAASERLPRVVLPGSAGFEARETHDESRTDTPAKRRITAFKAIAPFRSTR